jgi:hypothetical protein
MIAPYSPNLASVSLNCSIYYNFLCELPSDESERSYGIELITHAHIFDASSLRCLLLLELQSR